MSAKKDIIIEQGASFLMDLQPKDINGNPLDLANYQLRMLIADINTNTEVMNKQQTDNGSLFTSTNGVTASNGQEVIINGPSILHIELSPADTRALATLEFDETADFKYIIEIFNTVNGRVIRLLRGKVTVLKEFI